MSTAALERPLLAGVGAAAVAGILGTVWLLAHGTVPDWLLPVAAGTGIAIAIGHARRHRAAPPTGAPTSRGLLLLAVALVAGLAAVLAYGALATPSRHWDGAVAWDLKTAVLGRAPTLAQPFFRDPTVYCHSRDYPLLQPLLMALLQRWQLPERLVFPAAYLLLVAAIGAGARAAATSGRLAVLFALAAAVTPMWLSPTSGGFDSGYGDAVLATWLAVVALGTATANLPLVVCGLALAILQKPEGLPYAGLFLVAVWLHGEARLLRAATAAVAVAGALGLALQRDLQSFGTASPAPVIAAAAGGAVVVLVADLWLRRRGAGRRGRWLALLLGLVPAAIGVAVLSRLGDDGGVLGVHFADGGRPLQRLQQLPRIGLAMAEWAFGRGTFGLTFVVPIAVGLAAWRTGSGRRAPVLLAWLLLALPLWCVPFLTSPLADLDQHLRATLPRLLLHFTGVAWVWAASQPLPDPSLQRALGSHRPKP
ncbi:MAG: hypothetical protein JNM25_08815 [Planctomycetes bacterium]|nr:hypothetical protein [Planctomycetota bacterium]